MKGVGWQRHQEILRADLDLPPPPLPEDRGNRQCVVAGVLSHHQWALPLTVVGQVGRLAGEDQTIHHQGDLDLGP